jgi:hypothetical protein
MTDDTGRRKQHRERPSAKRQALRRLPALPDPEVEDAGAGMVEQMRREFEIAAKACAGEATVEDYKALGHTEAGARYHVEQDAAARAPPAQDPAASPAIEADYLPPTSPFPIGDRLTVYEAMMLWADREPYAPWLMLKGINSENRDDPAQSPARWDLMLFFADEATLNLCADIKADKIPLVKRAFRRNRLDRRIREIDITRCVISREVLLDFAERIGGYGNKIAELLAARSTGRTAEAPPTPLPVTPKRRGRRPTKINATAAAIREDIKNGRVTPEELENMTQEALAARYAVSRHTARDAMKKVVRSPEWTSGQFRTKDN